MNSGLTDITSKRRDKLGIIAEILGIAQDETLKTQIMYRANLSFTQLNDYLKLLTYAQYCLYGKSKDRQMYFAVSNGFSFSKAKTRCLILSV